MDTQDSPTIIVTSGTPEPLEVIEYLDSETNARKWTDSLLESLIGPSVAAMPVEKEAFEYNMKHKHRGIAVILNNKDFSSSKLSSRNGTDRDRDNLKMCLEHFGFDVKVYNDPSAKQVRDIIYQMSTKEDHSDRDCFFLAVFSHGDKNEIHAYDESYKPEMLWDLFRADSCPTLAGKPKIFLVQACQGDQLDHGTTMKKKSLSKAVEADSVDSSPHKLTYVVPNQADFLIAYSTFPGYYSWRSQVDGTWFIQAFTKMLQIYGKERDLLSLMTMVSREVALNFESNVPGNFNMHGKKQVPYITSTLIRDIFFR